MAFLKNNKRIFFSLLLVASLFLVRGEKQGFDKFSGDPVAFPLELLTYFGQDLPKEVKSQVDNFIVFWNTGSYLSDAHKKLIIAECNQLVEKKCLAVPHMSTFLKIIGAFGQTNHPVGDFETWLRGISGSTELKAASASQLFKVLSNTQVLLDSSSIVYRAAGHVWSAQPRAFKFVAGAELVVSFHEVELECNSSTDSIAVKKTSGQINLLTGQWKGQGGIVTWEKNGLSQSVTNAKLRNYAIALDQNGFNADSVEYVNTAYLKEKILGTLSSKLEIGIPTNLLTYPRFKSYKQRYVIKNIFENVDFDGGLEVKGSSVIGYGSSEDPVTITIRRPNSNGKTYDFIRTTSRLVILKESELRASKAQVSLFIEQDSIFHSNVDLIYKQKQGEVFLVHNNRILSQSPYYDSYHKMSFTCEQLYWKTGTDELLFSGAFGSALNRSNFESQNFFNIDRFDGLMGTDEQHPVYALRNFAKKHPGAQLTAQGFANYLRKNVTDTRVYLMRMAQLGYVFYDVETEEIRFAPKLMEALKARSSQIDYDVLQFVSETNGGKGNAKMSLSTNDMFIYGIDNISVSDSQNVYIAPRGGNIIMKKNRNFSFDGGVRAGLFTFYGDSFAFDYANFKFSMNKVDSLHIDIQTNQRDAYGQRVLARVNSTLESISGDLLIDKPNNKSGLELNPEYPIFRSTKESYVYYDSPEIFDGIYKRKKFFFRVDPYTIDSLNQFEKADLKFQGQFESDDIFPPFEETLSVRPDNSLGFVHKTTDAGLRAYKGKGVFYNNVDLSNQGLIGKGALTYLTSRTTSPGFFFFPDSALAITDKFVLGEQLAGIEFPDVVGEGNRWKWLPRKDTMKISYGEKPFLMFNSKSSLMGDLILTPVGLIGNGTTVVENAQLVSKKYRYDARRFKSDTTSFNLFSREQNLAFAADSVKALVDMDKREGTISKNGAFIRASLPEVKYSSFLDALVWHMDKYDFTMTATRSMPVEKINIVKRRQITVNDTIPTGAIFVSTRADQDTLNFVSPLADYSIDSATIRAKKVKYLLVADAQVKLGDGNIDVARGGLLRPFKKAEIFVDKVGKFHRLYDADVAVLRGMDYKASGKYDYIDYQKNVQTFFFKDISVDKSRIETYANATLTEPDSFKLSPEFDFMGDINLKGSKHFLEFYGGVRPIHSCPGVVRSWLRFQTEINPDSVVIPFREPVFDVNQSPLFTGTFIASDSIHIFPGFLSYHKFFLGDPVATSVGYLYFQKNQGKFVVSSPALYGHSDTTGNRVTLNRDFCMLEAEGKLSLASKFGRMEINIAGTHTYMLEEEKAKLDVVMDMDFFFNQLSLQAMAADLNTMKELAPVDMGRISFVKGIQNIVGYTQGKQLLNELNLYGKITTLPPQLMHSIVLTDLVLVWNQETKSFVSKGDIGIGMLGGVQVHKKVKGFVEVVKRRSGDLITLYLEPAPGKYYLFAYIRGTMHIAGYSDAFVVPISGLSGSKRTQPGKRGQPHFNYVITDRNVLGAARKRFAEINAGATPDEVPDDVPSGQ
ncbi:hypothetical protein [Williamwhitmania taraxaci]|uniref:Uncharacterized protein n=1 Tax=Williamwhitmania taraxaci TaxID=1640674 RepID=A0A1G6JB31_9BACT|nr:hypothetical protein [Williamwhitmania taraxaci]SDC15879.1 hypothetical protein SAMN05216323_101931 [Williamwhitmania taraxaci]